MSTIVNDIDATFFGKDLTEADFDGTDFGSYSIRGKRVLKRLLRNIKV